MNKLIRNLAVLMLVICGITVIVFTFKDKENSWVYNKIKEFIDENV